MVRRLGLGKTNHLTYASLALNPRVVLVLLVSDKAVDDVDWLTPDIADWLVALKGTDIVFVMFLETAKAVDNPDWLSSGVADGLTELVNIGIVVTIFPVSAKVVDNADWLSSGVADRLIELAGTGVVVAMFPVSAIVVDKTGRLVHMVFIEGVISAGCECSPLELAESENQQIVLVEIFKFH